jgi:3-isopropylmalate/(R)-2-methylmalate dehydratase large subunit
MGNTQRAVRDQGEDDGADDGVTMACNLRASDTDRHHTGGLFFGAVAIRRSVGYNDSFRLFDFGSFVSMTPMTLTEKILARHAGRDTVRPGDNIWVDVDVLMTHDVCGPGTIGVFKQHFGSDARVWDRDKVVIIPDHYIFTQDRMANRNVDVLRAFVREQGLPHYYDVGTDRYKGVCHIALPEEGHTRPGEVLLGTDSHTCTAGAFGEFATGIGNTDAGFVLGTGKLWLKVPPTMRFVFHGELPPYLMAKDLILAAIGDIGCDGATYRAMEFDGEAVYGLNIEERMTLCNMVIEAGGKNGVIAPDQVTLDYVNARNRSGKPYTVTKSDPGASFITERVYDVSQLAPVVARPHSPDNKAAVSEVRGTRLDRAYIGSCTGGKLTDFRAAAKVLQGKSVKIDTFVVPATSEVAAGLETEKIGGRSLKDIFLAAGAKLGQPSCAACLGGPSDTFGRLNEPLSCISTTNRNFPGRMGHKEARVYLASPLTVAASALRGEITDPREYLE